MLLLLFSNFLNIIFFLVMEILDRNLDIRITEPSLKLPQNGKKKFVVVVLAASSNLRPFLGSRDSF